MSKPERPSRPKPPPTSSSHSLFGLEKVIPPEKNSNEITPGSFALSWDTQPLALTTSELNKPLPQRPPSVSSIYSDDSGYTDIIQSYAQTSENEVGGSPQNLHNLKAYRETASGLLGDHLSQISLSEFRTASTERPQETENSTHSMHETQASFPFHLPESRQTAPSFLQFSRRLQLRHQQIGTSKSQKLYSLFSRDSRSSRSYAPPGEMMPVPVSHESEYLPGPMCARVSEVVDTSLLPPPLDLGRRNQSPLHSREQDNQSNIPGYTCVLTPQQPVKRLSQDSFTDDSFIIYDGAGEVMKALFKDLLRGKKRHDKEQNKKISSAHEHDTETKYKPLQNADSKGRKYSWTSSGSSNFREGTGHLAREPPTRDSEQRNRTASQSHGRGKHLAIPATPYQRYGADIWLAKNKRKRAKRRAERELVALSQGSPSSHDPHRASGSTIIPKAEDIALAIQSGRSQLLHALDETKQRMSHGAAERRRRKLKESIRVIRPCDSGGAAGSAWI